MTPSPFGDAFPARTTVPGIAEAGFMLRHLAYRTRTRLRDPALYAHLKRLRKAPDAAGYSLTGYDRLHCIFVHVPKCAGVSVNRALFGDLGGGHIALRHYLVAYGPLEFHRFFKFTFVRNPWDRLVSAFHFLKRGGFNEEDRQWAEKHLAACPDFHSFVMGWLDEERLWSIHHLRPQHHYLCVEDSLAHLDFIGRYERLEADFDLVCRRLGLDADLGTVNRGEHRDYRSYYDDAAAARVATLYARDIALLGYEFGGIANAAG